MIRRLSRTLAPMQRLVSDNRGVTAVEFALVAPVLCVMLLGVCDIAHTQYTSSMLNGAMQKAARDVTLENANSRLVNIDARVRAQVETVMPNNATITVEQLSHFDFADVAEAEEFTDQNGDDICNNNEPFIDSNRNGSWDADRGEDGIGGARDVVLYTTTVTYPRLFPMHGLIGLRPNVELSASTVLRRQPFDEQRARSTTPGNCT